VGECTSSVPNSCQVEALGNPVGRNWPIAFLSFAREVTERTILPCIQRRMNSPSSHKDALNIAFFSATTLGPSNLNKRIDAIAGVMLAPRRRCHRCLVFALIGPAVRLGSPKTNNHPIKLVGRTAPRSTASLRLKSIARARTSRLAFATTPHTARFEFLVPFRLQAAPLGPVRNSVPLA
jgi:hypothetical protein